MNGQFLGRHRTGVDKEQIALDARRIRQAPAQEDCRPLSHPRVKDMEGGYNGVPSVKTIAAMRELPVKAPPGVPSLELLMKRMDDEPSSVVPLKLQQQAAANAAASSSSPNEPQDAYGYSRSSFKFGLDHHEELEEPIPAYEAEKMRERVLRIVRRQQGCWPGCQCVHAARRVEVEFHSDGCR